MQLHETEDGACAGDLHVTPGRTLEELCFCLLSAFSKDPS